MSKRRSIEIEGLSHANPIPVASIVGGVLMSSIMGGRDPVTGKLPPTLEEQLANLFLYTRRILEAAGGTTDDILKMNFWLRDPSKRSVINAEWVKMFPDASARPARHTQPMVGDGEALVQCDVMAVVARG